MKYHELTTNTTTNKSTKRVGRGIAAGQGKTAGRGTKGQKARAGYSRKPGFEGGQNPLSQRFPKLRGFNSHRTSAEVVYTDELESLGAKVTNVTLAEAGILETPYSQVKLLLRGEYKKKQAVELQGASKTAQAAIMAAGGTFKTVPQIGRPETKKAKAEK